MPITKTDASDLNSLIARKVECEKQLWNAEQALNQATRLLLNFTDSITQKNEKS